MKLALSIPDSEAHNPIKRGTDRGCKELDGDVNPQPDRLKKRKQERDGETGKAEVGEREETRIKGSEERGCRRILTVQTAERQRGSKRAAGTASKTGVSLSLLLPL